MEKEEPRADELEGAMKRTSGDAGKAASFFKPTTTKEKILVWWGYHVSNRLGYGVVWILTYLVLRPIAWIDGVFFHHGGVLREKKRK